MKLSDHFDSSEFACHDGSPFPSDPDVLSDPTRLPKLCAELEKIRAAYGQPVHVLSGYRSPAYNIAIYQARGEKPTKSQHSEGRAADIQIEGVDALVLHDAILEMYKQGNLDIGGLGYYDEAHGNFVHVDVRVGWDHLAQWSNYGS